MDDMKPHADAAFGHVASARADRLPGIEAALARLFEIGDRHKRSYATVRSEILIFRTEAHTPIRIGLPALIRGSLVTNLLDFVELEADRPIAAEEIDLRATL